MISKIRFVILSILLAAGITGCAGIEPMQYHDDRESMKGPGLFTGEKGEFTVEILKGD